MRGRGGVRGGGRWRAKRADSLSHTYTTQLLVQLRALGLPDADREWRFHPARRWRFDLAWPERKVAVEIQGGLFSNGRHARGAGISSDYEKGAAATLLGWRVFWVTPHQIKMGQAANWVAEAMK